MTTVREIMTEWEESLYVGDTALDAARQLSEHQVHAVPIRGPVDTLWGVVTERDIVTKVVAPLEDPREVRVGELVEVASAAVDVDDGLAQVLRLMSERGIQDMPVVDGSRLVGLVAKADVVRALEYSPSGHPVAAARRG